MADDCPCCESDQATELPPKEMRRLVDKVYALFLRDLKIEQERRRLRPQSQRVRRMPR